jgi:Flp pilus assembly protein TadG
MVVVRLALRRFIGARDGNAATEFAFVAPATILLLLGIVVYSMLLSTYSALQQIAAEAARAALPGQDATQQSQFANQYVSGVLPNYSFIDPSKLTVSTTATATTFKVALNYDASASFFSKFASSVVPTPLVITRSATVQLSGF